MVAKPVSPFNGKPATEQVTNADGIASFHVRPYELTPLRAKIADIAGSITALGLNAAGIIQFEVFIGEPDWLWAVALVGPWLAYPLIRRLYRVLLKKGTEIVITPEQFKFRTWKGWQTYDRQLPHKFALIPHDRAQAEKEEHDLEIRQEQARRQIISKTRYYGESYHLSFEYLGQRNDVLTIYGRKEALAVLARLKACDEVMDSQARMGDGIALDPEDQWSDQPGEIK